MTERQTARDELAEIMLDIAGSRSIKRGWPDTAVERLHAAGWRIVRAEDLLATRNHSHVANPYSSLVERLDAAIAGQEPK
jgi:hypothetical protein